MMSASMFDTWRVFLHQKEPAEAVRLDCLSGRCFTGRLQDALEGSLLVCERLSVLHSPEELQEVTGRGKSRQIRQVSSRKWTESQSGGESSALYPQLTVTGEESRT